MHSVGIFIKVGRKKTKKRVKKFSLFFASIFLISSFVLAPASAGTVPAQIPSNILDEYESPSEQVEQLKMLAKENSRLSVTTINEFDYYSSRCENLK